MKSEILANRDVDVTPASPDHDNSDSSALAAVTGLLGLVEPLVRPARERVRHGLARLLRAAPWLPFDAHIEDLLHASLRDQLLLVVSRTAVLEMHVARVQGDLRGETPQDRYRDFIEQLRDPDFARRLLGQYALLERQVARAAEQWATFSLEFATNLRDSWPELLQRFFAGRHPGRLVQIRGGAGDRHHRGRSVLILEFASGARLVYKPRPLAVDGHFQKLLVWLNNHGATPEFRTLNLLDRGNHGWVEFVPATTCQTRDQVERFYRRQGGFLAILYLLSATDMHFENLIAAGEHPMFVDLEALFHQPVPGPVREVATEGLAQSVTTVRMLPQVFQSADSERFADYSALAAPVEQSTAYLVPSWENVGTDEMRITLRRALMSGGHHRARLNGQPVSVADYEDDFVGGFIDTYLLLAGHREKLLADDGPIAAFVHDEVRFIARITHIYAILLVQGFHPDRLSSHADREALLARLKARTAEFPCLARLLAAERDDLDHNDVPIFHAKPGSTDLWTSSGEKIEDFFPGSSLERVRARICELGNHDLARQLWLIRTSLALAARPDATATKSSRPIAAVTRSPTAALAEARAIGDRLASLAWGRADEIGWADLDDKNGVWSIGPVDCDVATGLAGVSIFFAHLGHQTSDERYTTLARRAAETLLMRIKNDAHTREDLSSLPEGGGVAEAIAHLGRLWSNSDLVAQGELLRRQLGVSAKHAAVGQADTWALKSDLESAVEMAARATRLHGGVFKVPPGVERIGLGVGLAGRGLKLLSATAAGRSRTPCRKCQ